MIGGAQGQGEVPGFVLLTTTSGAEDAVENCRRMIAGLRAQEVDGVPIFAILLVQQDAQKTAEFAQRIGPPEYMRVLSGGGRMPLSHARNQMLQICSDEKLISANDIVAFPDDDSWYPEKFLRKIHVLFDKDPFFDFFFCSYGSKPVTIELGQLQFDPGAASVVREASSNTTFVRGRVAKAIGGFDPELGVGTKNKSGEDTDYAIRAYFSSDLTACSPHQLVGHRDKDPKIRAKYYRGSLIVLSRYALISPAMLWLFVRKLAIGAVFSLLLRLGPLELISAFIAALRSFGSGKFSRSKPA